jgi:NAD(P)-dependent dehydrogenase (short-subunit alcohol dehydrogenase family)
MTALDGQALAGRVVLVSGGTQGVGAAAARRVLQAGADAVMVTGRDPNRGEACLAGLRSWVARRPSAPSMSRTSTRRLDQ